MSVQFSLCNVNVIQYVYSYLLKYTPIFRFGQCRHILFRVLDRHRPGGLNPTWWSIPILHIYQNESHTFLFNSECVITLPVYLSKHNWENLPLTIKGHDFVKCYISLFCTLANKILVLKTATWEDLHVIENWQSQKKSNSKQFLILIITCKHFT